MKSRDFIKLLAAGLMFLFDSDAAADDDDGENGYDVDNSIGRLMKDSPEIAQ